MSGDSLVVMAVGKVLLLAASGVEAKDATKHPTVQKIKQEFVVTDDMWKLLVDMGEKENIKLDTLQLEKSKKYLSLQLKALIARDMMDNQAYFEVINDENDALRQAILLLQNKEKYNRVLKGKNQMK